MAVLPDIGNQLPNESQHHGNEVLLYLERLISPMNIIEARVHYRNLELKKKRGGGEVEEEEFHQ